MSNLTLSRNSKEYKIWRKEVLSKCGNMCIKCKSKKSLHAHHIKSWAKYPQDRYNVSNGVILCYLCHKEKHPYMNMYKAKEAKPKKVKKPKKAKSWDNRAKRRENAEKRFSVKIKYGKSLDYNGSPKRGFCKP